MKRVHKLIISAVALVICGLVVFIIGMSLLDWDFKRLDVTEYTAKVFVPTEEVSEIKLDVDSFPVRIVRGSETRLEYYEATTSEVSVRVNDGVLSVVEKYSRNFFKYGMFNFGRKDHQYVLTVTDETEISIGGINGDVKFDKVDFDKVKIDMTNLDADFSGCTIGELDIYSDNLDIDFEYCALTTVKINADNCDIQLADCRGGSVEIKTINTSVDVARVSLSSFKVVATNADVSLERASSQTIDLRGTNADISLENITVDNLTVAAQNLSADIEIAGKLREYT
ncbi:MAG: DUF4097 domain-containing protein, partial [Clostridiales bacterium]|nr:DUF4097 domain-containing protein [Clostridiales bacterium]